MLCTRKYKRASWKTRINIPEALKVKLVIRRHLQKSSDLITRVRRWIISSPIINVAAGNEAKCVCSDRPLPTILILI